MDRQSLEPGLMLFIKRKLENTVPLRTITDMLLRAGFTEKQIEEAVQEVHNKFPETHQDVVAANSFLPPLKEKTRIEEVRPVAPVQAPVAPVAKPVEQIKRYPSDVQKGLLKGRLRRRDFIVSFLLFFGEGIVLLAIILGSLSFVFPEFNAFIADITSPEHYGLWLLSIPFLLSPFTILLVSIITRRLHDLTLPGGIALGFLIFFVDPMNGILSPYGVIALQAMMGIVFVMLISVKGNPNNNQFGPPPEMKGALLSKIFNR